MADHTTAWERFEDWIKKVIELRGTDLHLVPGSPLVDAGDPGLLDPDGSRSDIGVHGGPAAGN